MRSDRDNIQAGIFVVIGVILALVIIFILSDYETLLEKTQEIKVYYRLSDGVKGLKPGAQITLGNQPVGAVSDITDATEYHPDDEANTGDQAPSHDRVVGKIVTFEIPSRYEIYQNAAIELVVPPLGSGTVLNIRSVGNGEAYTGSKPIRGGLAPSQLTKSLMREAGIEDQQRQQIKKIIANVERITTTLDEDLPQITGEAKEALAKVQPMLDEAKAGIADLRAAADNVKTVTGGVRERYEPWMENVDQITGNARSTTERIDKLVADKDPAVRESIDNLNAASGNVKEITQKVKDENLKQFTALLTRADTAIGNFEDTGNEIKGMLKGQRPIIERMLANMFLTAGQLKLAAIEVRRSPWRLMYRPTDDELETDNLYDATRTFALAAEALAATSDNLNALAKAGEDDPQVQRAIEQLGKVFDKFEQAEDDFWQALRRAGDGTSVQLEADSKVP